MDILFLNLPYTFRVSRTSRWPEKTKSGTLYYPYWLAYAAGYCQSKGFTAHLQDCIATGQTLENLCSDITALKPRFIVAEITTPTYALDIQTIRYIKQKFSDIQILVGGTHATALAEQTLHDCPEIDYILLREYEETLIDILNGVFRGQISSIAFLDGDNVIETAARPFLTDLDELPFISRVYKEFLNVNDYFYAFAQKPMIQIFSARGCPHQCNFCSYPETMGGKQFRKRSVENLVDELEYIQHEMPEIKEIFIEDDTFTVDKKRVAAICDEILQRGLHITWSCNTRVDLPRDVMEKMKRAGCRLLVTGYESGCQSVLDETKKGIKLEQSLDFARNTKQLGLKVFGCFMIGLKGDTLETIEETFKFAKRVYPDMCFFQQAVPFPGTDFYKWAKENGYLITEDYGQWLNKDGYLNCLVSYPYASPNEIEKLRDKLMSRYYFSFTYIVKTFLKNLSWIEFKCVMKAGFAYIGFRVKKVVRTTK